jgi:hypothetical protein
MNERILNLMIEAGFDVEKLRMYPGGFPREDLLILEDFAKLVVRDCAEIVNSLEQFEGQGDCSTAAYIKESFGV